jgi:hypothetical protein
MELIALLTTAKEMGLEVGPMISMVIIYFMLKKFVTKQNKELKDALNVQVDKVVGALENQNKRLTTLESDNLFIKKKLSESGHI